MDPQLLVFLFLICGLALIFVELFVPSGGMIAVMAACCFIASGYSAYQSWYGSYPLYWWIYIVSIAFLIPLAIWGAIQILTRTKFGNRVLMPAPTLEEVTPFQSDQAHLESLIGKRGRSLSPMNPGGMVLVQGERLHATSEGLMVDANRPIEVVAARGTRIVVREVDSETEPEPVSLVETEEQTPPEPEKNAPGKQSSEEIFDPFLTDDLQDKN
ncbi:NfeD family protein [Planctomicrobium sp. SH668]|uniref:NfeD family protein n=1 Tax=Planctomicrobium sp. SH668 TaxID=3448126 RepID=UPI003F5B5EE6